MSKEIYISSTPHETRLAIVENDALSEIYYERENEYTLAGSIYNGRVTRVLPGMQSSFVDIGLERDAFLYITDFLEEAADGAEFDGEGRAAKPRSEGSEGARSEGGRSEGGRSEGGRGERSGRGDRNGRRDGRGPRDERPRDDKNSEQPRAAMQNDDAGAAVETEAGEGAVGEGVVGEGAPGADGGRRWRGRRGRRRGRGAGEGEEATPGAEGSLDSVEGAAEVEAVAEAPAPAEGRERERGGRDRNGRGGRDRGGRDRGNRQDSVRDRFAPRASSGESEASPASSEPAAEPFLLPGESLSKYRRGGEAEAPSSTGAATPSAPAKPSTEMAPLVGWDGGLTLPGETLSRHRGGNEGAGTESRGGSDRGGRGDRDRGGRDRGGRDRNDRNGRDRSGQERGNREARGNEARGGEARPARTELSPAEAVQPAVTSQHEPEPFELQHPHVEPVSGDLFEAAPYTSVGGALMKHYEAAKEHGDEAASEAAAGTAHESANEISEPVAAAEYEPAEDASASLKSETEQKSKFRWGWGKNKDKAEEKTNPAPAFKASEADAYVEGSEFTSVQPTGEMISAPATEKHAGEHADAPIEHEGAVQSVTLREARGEATRVPQQFAPGQGQLEEETIDDEDGELPALHAAGHAANHDESEHETLEGAADLATMIHEMSIDEITRPEEPEEDDFDIDEEDLSEDAYDNGDDAEDEAADDAGDEGEAFGDTEQREEGEGAAAAERSARPVVESERRPRRDGRRGSRDRGGRDGGRDGGREAGRESRDRRPSSGRSSGGGGRSSRHSMQSTNLPAISDLLKPGQELLVQIAKEPIAKKGARITSHIALPGRFLVFMPTVSHIGVSRKIESEGERRRLKEILLSERGDATGGFIVRTAAANAGEDELRSDLRFLLNLWADIKARSESSKSPALIYHDLNLVERILRDQVTDNFSAIWVDTEDAYERVLRFLQRFQPSLIRRVKLYTKETPLFEQFGITEEINKALRSKVWLKSGGSIVINQTEALVAIDINTGKFVGKTARLEDTIVKTNLDAIPEIVRQIRLRDLGGIIIIDFIDMDERKNRHKVMAALEEELKSDRAPSKVLQFNDFGLVAITRKRVKQSLERTLSSTCGVCQGTGMTKSPVTVCNDIYVEMRKMQKHLDRGDVMLRVNPEVVKQLKAPGTKWLQEMEEMVGRTILVKSDPSIHPEQFDIH